MDCKEARELLHEPGDRSEALRAHLAGCAGCRMEQRTWDLLLQYPEVEADLLSRVRRRVRSPMGRILWFAAPAAAAAAILVVLAILSRGPEPQSPAPDPVQTELRLMEPQDRELLLALSKDEDRELIENIDLVRSLELVGGEHLNGEPFHE